MGFTVLFWLLFFLGGGVCGVLPKRGSTAEDAGLGARPGPRRGAPEEAVMFDALLPEILALVASVEVELDRLLVVALLRQPTKEKKNSSYSSSLCPFPLFPLYGAGVCRVLLSLISFHSTSITGFYLVFVGLK